MEKEKVKIKLDESLKTFLKKHILKSFKILTIIGIALILVIISSFCSLDNSAWKEMGIEAVDISFMATIKDRIIILLLILIAGWVPYFYISMVSYIAYVFMLARDLLVIMFENGRAVSILLFSVPGILDIVTVSMIAAIGMYMCKYTGKKYKYAQRTSFSFIDIKLQFYEMTKQKEKYEKALEIKKAKLEKMKENDVKIDYKNIVKVVAVMGMLNLVMCILEYCIK